MKKLGLTQYAIECLEGKHTEEKELMTAEDEFENTQKKKLVDDETEEADKNALKDVNSIRDDENKMIYESCFRYRKKTANLYK